MATFPKLKTGAIAQYPATRSFRFVNQVVRFVDGSEQRYRDSAGPLRAWALQLDMLDEQEIAALQEFAEENQGQAGTFTFIDPLDNTAHSGCRFANDQLELISAGELRGAVSLRIIQTRG